MNKKLSVTLLMVIIAVLAFSFYRYGYQPKQIRQKCATKQLSQLNGITKDGMFDGSSSDIAAAQASNALISINRFFYDFCLHSNGLDK